MQLISAERMNETSALQEAGTSSGLIFLFECEQTIVLPVKLLVKLLEPARMGEVPGADDR